MIFFKFLQSVLFWHDMPKHREVNSLNILVLNQFKIAANQGCLFHANLKILQLLLDIYFNPDDVNLPCINMPKFSKSHDQLNLSERWVRIYKLKIGVK